MKKNILITGGIVVLVLLLAGAALIGGRLLRGQGLPGLSSRGPQVFTNPDGGQTVRINADDIQPANELPQTAAAVRGLFDRRDNNSIFVGTGEVRMIVQTDQSGNPQISSSHSGPTLEVVVTTQTTVYHDTTMEQFNGPPPSGQKIQQVVEPGSLDEVGQDSTITVWGKKTGNRVVADILVYTSPAFIK